MTDIQRTPVLTAKRSEPAVAAEERIDPVALALAASMGPIAHNPWGSLFGLAASSEEKK